MRVDLKRAWDSAVRAAENRAYIRGRLGRTNPDGSVSLSVAGRPGHVYVAVGPDGSQGVTHARNLGVPLRAHLPVRMRREGGVLVIHGLDYGPQLDASLAGETPSPYGLPWHHHGIGSGLEYVHPSLLLEPGRVYSAGGMNVTISPFRYFYNGAWDTYMGGALDLTANKPATVGHWAWVLVGVNPATNALVSVTGSSVTEATPLTLDLLDTIAFGSNIPLSAIKVKQSDTALTEIADYADAHGWFNQGVTDHGMLSGLGDDDHSQYHTDARGDARYYRENEHIVISVGVADAGKPIVLDAGGQLDGSLLDDTDIDHGSIGGLGDDDHAQYVRLSGRAGGQTAYGGTAASEHLELSSTAHATKGHVLIQANGGNVGIGLTNPTTQFHVQGPTAGLRLQRDNGFAFIDLGKTGITTEGGRVMAVAGALGLTFGSFGGATEWARFDASGNFGIGGVPAAGRFHVWDGTAGSLHWSNAAVANSAVTIIPNGTGDVTRAIQFFFVVDNAGTVASGQGLCEPGGGITAAVAGGGTWNFVVSAVGAFTVQRVSGTGTAKVSVWAHWI